MGFESGAGEFMQNSAVGTYSAAQMRRSTFAWAARTSANTPGLIAGGLLSGTDMQLSAASSGLVVYTSVGECLIPGTEATSQGGVHAFLSSQNSTTLATANATNPRIDLICATYADPQYTIPSGGTSGYVTIQGVTGTPTSGATLTNLSGKPSLPASSLLLGYVLVPASATSITSADIASKAPILRVGGLALNDVASLGARQINGGYVSLTWPGGTIYSNGATIGHGLPGTPVFVGGAVVGSGATPAAPLAFQLWAGSDATNIYPQLVSSTTQAAGSNYAYWFAVG